MSPIVPLAHDVTGSGPLVVLVHGITENRHSWDPVVPLLSPHARVLRVDLRGHGESPAGDTYDVTDYAADLRAVVEEQDGGDAALVVGHSLGGIVATGYGSAYPTGGVVNVDQPLALGALAAQVRELEPLLRSEAFSQVMHGMFAQMQGDLPDPEFARLTALRRPDASVVLGTWALMLDLDDAALAAKVDEFVALASPVPYLAVHGTDLGPDYTAWLTAHIPAATVELWRAGHYPHLIEPQRFADRLVALLP